MLKVKIASFAALALAACGESTPPLAPRPSEGHTATTPLLRSWDAVPVTLRPGGAVRPLGTLSTWEQTRLIAGLNQLAGASPSAAVCESEGIPGSWVWYANCYDFKTGCRVQINHSTMGTSTHVTCPPASQGRVVGPTEGTAMIEARRTSAARAVVSGPVEGIYSPTRPSGR